MKYVIRWLDKDRKKAEVTAQPSWLARLFGFRKRVTSVYYNTEIRTWYYWIDGSSVPYDMRLYLDEARRWDVVESLPAARMVEDDG